MLVFETTLGNIEVDLFEKEAPVTSANFLGYVDDGFFDLGGDSIMSIQLVGRARRVGLELSVRDVFEHRTVAALAEVVTEAEAPVAEEPGAAFGTVEPLPITRWLAGRTDLVDAFNMSAVLRVPAGLGLDALTGAARSSHPDHAEAAAPPPALWRETPRD